jgi:hypothetical protein
MKKETFEEAFPNALKLAKDVFESHNEERGDSWKECNISYLFDRLDEEWEEFNYASHIEKAREAIDCVNFLLMIAERFYEETEQE